MELRRIAAVILMLTFAMPAQSTSKRLWILVPVFSVGEASAGSNISLGSKVSTLMFLQLFTTLRKRPSPNPEDLDFGDAGVTWDSESLPPTTFEEAERLAITEDEDPIMTFWGDIADYGNSLFISSRLSIRTDGTARSVTSNPWSLNVALGSKTEQIGAGLPQTRYEFGAFPIPTEIVATLKQPGGLNLLDAPRANAKSIGHVGDYFRRISQSGRFAEIVRPGEPKTGWIYTPSLSSDPTEALLFTSGLLRVFRQDWQGAKEDFLRAKQVDNAPAAVKLSTKLLLALCLSNLGDSRTAILLSKEGTEFDPYSFVAAQYLAMSYLASINRLGPSESSAELMELRHVAADVLPSRVRTTDDLRWLEQLHSIVSELDSRNLPKQPHKKEISK